MVNENLKNTVVGFTLTVIIAMLLPMTLNYGIRLLSKQTHPFYSKKQLEQMSPEEREMTKQKQEDNYYDIVKKQNYFYFYSFLIAGAACILAGAFLKIGFFIGSGLVIGGILCLISACFQMWHKFSDFMKFGILLFALLVILYLALLATKRVKF